MNVWETVERDVVIGMLRSMVRLREAEESFVQPILDGAIRCPVHLYSGQEAIAVGVCLALTDDDYVFGSHRSHGHFLAKGGSLTEMIAEVYCRESGCSKGRGGSMHLIDVARGMLGAAPIVGGTISLAMGAALAARIRGKQRVSVSFFGDGATGEGVLHETMNFAALQKLPLLLVCENNLYSTHMSIADIRPNVPIASLGAAHGIETVQVDGNDVVAVAAEAGRLIARCRSGQGPAFMECLTYRRRGHVGPDDNIQGTHTDIRPAEELAAWRARDPIELFKASAIHAGVLTEDDFTALRDGVLREVAEAHAAARASRRPAPEELGEYVFSA